MPERQWDSDLSRVRVEGGLVMGVRCGALDAITQPGETYFKLISAAFIDEREANGQHHVFADVLDENGRRLAGQIVEHGWPWNRYPAYDEFVTDTIAANHVAQWGLYAGYDPNRMDYGPYWVRVRGKSDVFYGMGLPWNRHVTYALVFQRMVAGAPADPPEPPEEPTPPTPPTPPAPPTPPDVSSSIRQAAWRALYPSGGVNYNPNAAFAIVARDRKLGVPVTQELNYQDYRYQGFAGGIIYSKVGKWDKIEIIAW